MHLVFFLLLLLLWNARSEDADALLTLKSSIDPMGVIHWVRGDPNVCQWEGIRECLNGRVTKLVIERMNLTGTLHADSLNQLDQIRVLSFKENSLSGQIPELNGLRNLKSLYLNNNRFSGRIPASLASLHRLKVVVLAGNDISGPIAARFVGLSRLYVLYLQDNRLSGAIPPLDQRGLTFFNVSNNALSGEIPATAALARFNASAFGGNPDLCGEPVRKQCSGSGPAASPSYPSRPGGKTSRSRRKRVVLIAALTAAGVVALCILGLLAVVFFKKSRNGKENGSKVVEESAAAVPPGAAASGRRDDDIGDKRGGFPWDQGGEGLGSLIFLGPGDQQMNYGLEDLLKASAETLGRGTIGSTYKAVMESGYIVTVKRLKDARYPTMEEFRRHIEILGRLRHPNVVPLRAYFQAKEERLLVYDYFPNGSLFSLIHGNPNRHCLTVL